MPSHVDCTIPCNASTVPSGSDLYLKEIVFDRASRDYALYLNKELVGFARTYADAENTLNELVFELLVNEAELDAEADAFRSEAH